MRGVGQVARGDSALDGGLGLTGASDSSLKTLVARGEPADKLKPTSGGLDLNEVLSMKPHNRKKNTRILKKVKRIPRMTQKTYTSTDHRPRPRHHRNRWRRSHQRPMHRTPFRTPLHK